MNRQLLGFVVGLGLLGLLPAGANADPNVSVGIGVNVPPPPVVVIGEPRRVYSRPVYRDGDSRHDEIMERNARRHDRIVRRNRRHHDRVVEENHRRY